MNRVHPRHLIAQYSKEWRCHPSSAEHFLKHPEVCSLLENTPREDCQLLGEVHYYIGESYRKLVFRWTPAPCNCQPLFLLLSAGVIRKAFFHVLDFTHVTRQLDSLKPLVPYTSHPQFCSWFSMSHGLYFSRHFRHFSMISSHSYRMTMDLATTFHIIFNARRLQCHDYLS